MNNSMIIGLTGQTGAGKSSVAKILKNNYGYNIIDCDSLVSILYKSNLDLIGDLVFEFSDIILDKDSHINKKELAKIVFNNNSKLKRLNEIVFPYVTLAIEIEINKYRDENNNPIVIDAPTLFESGMNSQCALIISVVAPQELRKKRIMIRDNISEEVASKRMASQLSEEFFEENSQFVISNNDGMVPLKVKINMIAQTIDSFN